MDVALLAVEQRLDRSLVASAIAHTLRKILAVLCGRTTHNPGAELHAHDPLVIKRQKLHLQPVRRNLEREDPVQIVPSGPYIRRLRRSQSDAS